MIKEGVMISGRYEIMGRIGTGGMADVYKGRDHKLNRYVAVKVLKREFREDELFVKKFQSEAQAAAGLMHPNIVNVYDVGEDRGLYFMVMELVEGITLKEYIQKKRRLTPKEVISITIQVCAGIETAHNNGIIHRDIKPQNIIISKEGKVKVTDFGIAKAASSNTISTNAMGSVHYTSPEQARGGFSDKKSDIYSLGITMFEMITGELPFDGDSTVAIAIKHLQEDIISPAELVPEIPYSLERIILKCTQKSPDRRYANMAQLTSDLKRSLVDPEGDFVTIAPFASVADTVMITPDELERIQQESEYDDEYEDEYEDEYDEYDDNEYDDEEEEDAPKRKPVKRKHSDVNPKMAKIMKILTIVVAVIIVFILVFTIGKATGIFKFGPKAKTESTDSKTVAVPDFVGKKQEEAEKLAKSKGLKLKVVSTKESKYEEGYIAEQKTGKGAKVKKGTIINVVVSSGIKGEEIPIPDVSGLTEAAAREELIKTGFESANISKKEREDDNVEAGIVIETTPEADAKAAKDTEITIIVSKGAGKAIVPGLKGKSGADAAAALSAAGLNGNPTEEYSDRPAGEVISQDTPEGNKVNRGTTIGYVVSKGPEPKKQVKVPDTLVGQYASSVKATLLNMGLDVIEKHAESTQFDEGYVIFVTNAGETVEEGTKIQITVSTGPGPGQDQKPNQTPEDDGETSAQ